MSSIEHLESRIAPASLTGRVLSYTDIDGDKVIVAFSKGTLTPANFLFDSAFDSTGTQQLQRIDIAALTDVEGSNITVKVARGPDGDGVAHIGEIIATGRDLGVVKTKGDLGKIVAGNNAAPAPGIKTLSIGSQGVFDGATQPAGAVQNTLITGNVANLSVAKDLAHGTISVIGVVSKLNIGGSIKGGKFDGDGQVVITGSIGKLTLGGSLLDSTGSGGGTLFVTENVDTITIRGSILGGAPATSLGRAQVEIGGSVKKMTVGGEIRGVSGVGDRDCVRIDGTVGSFSVGGSVTAIDGKVAVVALAEMVSGPGIAVGSVTIKGGMQNGMIIASKGFAGPVTVDKITIQGGFSQSRIAIGAAVGMDSQLGTADDVVNQASRLNSITIGGFVAGTPGGVDAFLIEAGRIGSAKLGGRIVNVGSGDDLINVSLTGDVFVSDKV